MKKIISSIAILTVVFNINPLFAQQDSLSVKNLEELIVTGQYKPQSLKKSVYQVRVINKERIKQSGATNVQQVLNNQLGFRFSNDNTIGTTDVQLMGMSGRMAGRVALGVTRFVLVTLRLMATRFGGMLRRGIIRVCCRPGRLRPRCSALISR